MSGREGDSFAERLSHALAERRVGLKKLSDELAEQGISCAPSTMSLWANGHTIPRRAEARRAVTALESLLGTPPGHLTEATQHAAPLSASWWAAAPDADSVPFGEILGRVREEFGLPERDGLQLLLAHDVVHHDEQRRLTRIGARLVLRATRDHCERMMLSTYTSARNEHGVRGLRRIVMRLGGRIARQRTFPESGHSVFEVVFDDPLDAGHVVVVEYDVIPTWPEEPDDQDGDAPGHAGGHEMMSSRPLGRMILEARFAENDLPTSVTLARATRAEDMDGAAPTPVELQGAGVVVTLAGVEGGGARLRWNWEDRA